ncbi:Plancitoxin-1 [Trichinella pseudospiralis]
MDTLSDGCILIWLVLNSLITTDDEEDLKKPVTNVVSENGQTEGSALYEEDDERNHMDFNDGFPTAKTPYTWPAAENARGHLLICLTISESQINAIAASLLLVQPIIYYNDIPESETAGMPYFKKLAEGQTPTMPPFTSRRSIRTQSAGAPVTVHIYSKSESSKYGKHKQLHKFQTIL